ncbi:ParB N-terminal domain-containing protein [Arthrobacter sp. KNU40]|uniref:ParB N-terminal domain-containing protein n=1 Tax=Arthrobacter sp. KNU40 TaxID=3447965 RepID=UPI003F5E5774
MDEYRSALSTQLQYAETECQSRQQRLQRAQRDIEDAPDTELRHLVRERDACSRRLYVSKKAVQEIREASSRFSALSARFRESINRLGLRARTRLTFLDEAVAVYATNAWRSSGTSVSLGGESSGEHVGPAEVSGLHSLLNGRGMRMIDVNAADFADNPILSWKAEQADYAWACEKWEQVIMKVIEQGGGREELANRDMSSGETANSMRQLAHVWDLFLGSDPIRLDTKPDGAYEVIGGRHRLQVARQLGIARLPAVVSERTRP